MAASAPAWEQWLAAPLLYPLPTVHCRAKAIYRPQVHMPGICLGHHFAMFGSTSCETQQMNKGLHVQFWEWAACPLSPIWRNARS